MSVVRYRDGNGNIMPLRVIRGEDGNQMFVRYSVYPDGTDMSETWDDTMSFMGIALAPVNAVPTDKSDYQWIRASSLKMFEGSYVGTGTAGPGNPITLNLPFVPKVLIINSDDTAMNVGIWVKGSGKLRVFMTDNSSLASAVSGAPCKVTSETTVFTWRYQDNNTKNALNIENLTYWFVAIG